jgi:hypothetical protein
MSEISASPFLAESPGTLQAPSSEEPNPAQRAEYLAPSSGSEPELLAPVGEPAIEEGEVFSAPAAQLAETPSPFVTGQQSPEQSLVTPAEWAGESEAERVDEARRLDPPQPATLAESPPAFAAGIGEQGLFGASAEEFAYEEGEGFFDRATATIRDVVDALKTRARIANGVRDPAQLTNLIFFERHPARGGRDLTPGEPDFAALAAEWRAIRDTIVRPALQAATSPAPPVPPPQATAVWPTQPLPPDANERFRVALRALRDKISASGDARAWRYNCWLSKLEAGADDRVIEWHRICPRTTGAIGAAYIVGPCDLSAGSGVDQAALEAAVKSVQDVEPANQGLNFITFMRTEILFDNEMTSESLHLENFRRFHDDVGRAVDKLGKWANNPMGGSSAMPPAYVSIKDWIGARQRDPQSVYSCM